MKKNIFIKMLTALSVMCLMASCSEDDAGELTDYDISEIYGYTYYGTINASSGNTLTPALILYNDNRCDWNMSVHGMNNNQFYYFAVKNSTANYTMYWFSAENAAACAQQDTSQASMTVQLGINSLSEVVILLTSDDLTNVSGMTNTRVPMTKQNDIEQNTEPTEIEYDEEVEDVTITIPDTAVSARWTGSSSYTGTFVYMVEDGNGGYLAKGEGSSGTDSEGNEITPLVEIEDTNSTTEGTAAITLPRFAYTEEMTIEAFEMTGVQVSEDSGILYLYLPSTSVEGQKADGTTITMNELTVSGKLENGILTLRSSFKPGKMPFAIVQVFTSQSE
ncbi:hypothetical protein [Treponema sp.]|uniref:hypothetical protein n=1 Tax=Treponema sp. TaxID=166 RepID=UPI0025EA9852|nr:hypothetical protein [Treponema sp.]MCR5219060.1 hypothetical protein [Treponema sp.]